MIESPSESLGSLLLTSVILQETGPQLLEVEPLTLTGIILWLGGQRVFGLATTALIVGGLQTVAIAIPKGFIPTVIGRPRTVLLAMSIADTVSVVKPVTKARVPSGVTAKASGLLPTAIGRSHDGVRCRVDYRDGSPADARCHW